MKIENLIIARHYFDLSVRGPRKNSAAKAESRRQSKRIVRAFRRKIERLDAHVEENS